MKTGVSYFGNRMLNHYLEDLKDIKAHNCNFVLHTFSENDYFFYKDTMKDFVKASQDAGLEVYIDPWGVAGVFGGEADWRWLPKNIDASQIRNDGMVLGIACPNNEKYRTFMRDWTKVAMETGADVVFWDEPHFYIPGWAGHPKEMWGCCCNVCKELFRDRFGHDMPKEKNEEVIIFQEARLFDFLKDLCDTVKSNNPKIKNCICLLPHKDSIAGWSKFVSIPSLDIFGTDPYWVGTNETVTNYVKHFSDPVAKLSKDFNKEGQIWVQAFRIPKGEERDVATAIDVAYNSGIRNITAWAYRACGFMSHLHCDDSDKVWKIIGEKYGEKLKISKK